MSSVEVANSNHAVEQIVTSVAQKVFSVRSLAEPNEKITSLSAQNDPVGEVAAYLDEFPLEDGETAALLIPVSGLFNGLTSFGALSAKPVVFHTVVGTDYGYISALRHSGFVFLQSFGPEDAQDTALAAHLVARLLGKPVVHFYENVERAVPIRWSSEAIGASLAAIAASDVDPETSEGPKEPVPETPSTAIGKALSVAGLAAYEYRGDVNAKNALIVLGSTQALAEAVANTSQVGALYIRVYQPFDAAQLLAELPKSVSRLALCEQIANPTTAFLPIAQDILTAPATSLAAFDRIATFRLGAAPALSDIISNLEAGNSEQGLLIGSPLGQTTESDNSSSVAAAIASETAYFKVLSQLFPNIDLLNMTKEATTGLDTVPEYGFGAFLASEKERAEVKHKLLADAKAGKFSQEIVSSISKWALGDNSVAVIEPLQNSAELAEYKSQITPATPWLVGSDTWSYDFGTSGVHHVLASRKNINMLVIDSKPQSAVITSRQRKKDIGLYAMSFGNVYVASVAIYASYTQLLQALLEAASFNGPSIVVAYLPHEGKTDPLAVLKETKRAVDTGYWPLYRYDPRNDTDAFKLDSFTIRKNLEDFLARENKLSLLANKTPQIARDLQASYSANVRREQLKSAREAYDKLLAGLSGPPVLVLFASDGGQAEMVGRRLARRAKGRGLKASVAAFDDIEADDLVKETNVVFITSTAGQGEFPQNGRELWEQLKGGSDLDLSNVKVGVFGMGDSQYWPRKEDKLYYNKPSHDLWNRLTKMLGAQELVELGQGDDQDADGWATGYNDWEAKLWEALGVANVQGEDEPAPRTNEDIKLGSNYLRGTIAEGLKDKSTGAISADDQQLTKFHGIYMQDDRDVRDERKARGLEPAYSFMVRVRLPGCVATPEQWLKIDELSDSRGNGTFKITTRGTFQLHGVIKEDLKPAIRGMNAVLMDTVAACGDVDRNVVAAATPHNAAVHRQVYEVCNEISEHLLPRTTAYYEIWLEGEDASDGPGFAEAWDNRKDGCTKKPKKQLVSQSAIEDVEPLYGNVYLPRKFKINVAVPPYNDVDVYGHDIGLIAIVDKDDKTVTGFNVLVGGGMGTTHNNKKTYPRTGSLIGYAPREKITEVCEKVMLVQRDNGDRTNRKHARLKYTVDDMTPEGFKAEVEKYLGYPLEPARQHPAFKTNVDTYGWVRDEEGFNHFTTFVENGRVEDTPELQFRAGFREIAKVMQGSKAEFRLTANQHILVANISDEQKPIIDKLLVKYKLDNLAFSGLRLSSAACVAFPTCGLAMAESERYLPVLVTKLESALEEYGLRHDSVTMRMTGCPNGCARPWLAEVALVGKAYGAYNLYLGGGHVGERLNKLYRSSLKEEEILETLLPLFKSWSLERKDSEPFGDFVIRKGVISATREGKDWWENVEPGLE